MAKYNLSMTSPDGAEKFLAACEPALLPSSDEPCNRGCDDDHRGRQYQEGLPILGDVSPEDPYPQHAARNCSYPHPVGIRPEGPSTRLLHQAGVHEPIPVQR